MTDSLAYSGAYCPPYSEPYSIPYCPTDSDRQVEDGPECCCGVLQDSEDSRDSLFAFCDALGGL